MKKKHIEIIFIFIIVFLFSASNTLRHTQFDNDEYWTYHMTQKIYLGEVPYKEINIIITPLFYQIGAAIFKIFGEGMFVYKLYGAAILASVITMFYIVANEISKNKIQNIFYIFTMIWITRILYISSYNVLIFTFLLLALLLEIRRTKSEKKEKYDILIGIALALAFFTKQTIGGVAFALSLLYLIIEYKVFNEKGIIKAGLKRILGFLIVFIPYIIWFALSGALYNFIDFAFLGMLDFAEKNSTGSPKKLLMAISTVSLFVGFIVGLDKKLKDKTLILLSLYSFADILMIFPLTNTYHIIISSIIPTLIALKIIDIVYEHKYEEAAKISMLVYCATLIYASFMLLRNTFIFSKYHLTILLTISLIIVICMIVFSFIRDKYQDCFLLISTFLLVNAIFNLVGWGYIIYFENVPRGLEVYKYCGYDFQELADIYSVTNYVKMKEEQGYNVIIMSADASKYMIPFKRNNFKFDLLLQGNLGYKGEERVVEEIKQLENTLIMKRDKLIFQESKIVDNFIKENYKLLTNAKGFDVYVDSLEEKM